jgi:uncharacterized protein YifE (UPF0438 family)
LDADTPDELTVEEELLLKKPLNFYRSLARGKRTPATEAQQHFARVFCGQAAPETIHEKAYLNHLRFRAWQRESNANLSSRDPADGPSEEWFSREDWHKLRGRQRGDARDSGD